MKKQPLFLIGFMASGKTSLGKKLAKRLAIDFIDLDQLIEEEEQCTIVELFATKGEKYFRNVEAKLLRSISVNQLSIVSLGGGTPCHSGNIDYLNEKGLSIYLKRSNERLLGRLRQKKAKRPLIANLNDEELKEFIVQKMEERNLYYEKAQLIFDADATTFNELVHEVNSRISNS